MGDNAVKKIIKIIVPLVLIFVCVTGAFAQGTLSEEILNQAKREAGLFLELKSALGLDWLDEYNAYLENPTDNPEPSWDLSVADLVSGGYLSDSFPSDFMITKSGQEVKISRIITSQAMKDVLPIYLPSVVISGDTVSLLVQRPAQWVAWEAGLNSKISRDGGDDPDILPDASLEFGAGSKIEFVNNDGKLVGIDSLTYKGQELEDRFVNAAGDNMTGPLKINGKEIWHPGNQGSGTGLDADLLDGQHGSFYRNASNLNAGIVPIAMLSGTYNINISGRAAVASNADYASNSDKLDGKDSSAFALAHDHPYVNKVSESGDMMAGPLTAPEYRINDGNTRIYEGGNNSVRIQTNNGYVDIGPQNTGWVHFNTDRPEFYFGKPVEAEDMLKIYNTGTYLTATEGKINNQTIWHSGNDGSGSGMDADMLDGAHLSEILGGLTLKKVITYSNPGTYTFNKSSAGSKVYRIIVKCWGGGGGGGGGCHDGSVKQPVSWMAGGNGGASKFGSYMTANGGYGGQGATRYGGGSPGGGGTASGGEENLTGGAGEKGADDSYGGKGGNSPNGGSGGVRNSGNGYAPGGGGGGGSASGNGGGGNGGGGGGYCKRTFSLDSLPDSTQVVVGGGGAGGSPDGGGRGGSGAPGRVVIECWGL